MKLLMCLSLLSNDPQFEQIVKNKPGIEVNHAKRISCYARYACSKHDIDCDNFLAIMMAESSYRLNVVNSKSNDYGISQVNEFNIRAYKFNKKRLLTDLKYSINAGAVVYKWFDRTYEGDEVIMRFNCGTRPSCVKWKRVKKYLKKVKKFLPDGE